MVGQTHVTPVTVEVILSASNPAYSTACAVELLLVLVIIQFALEAEIFPEHCSASITALLYRLPQPADTALNLCDIVSPESVILLVVVTKPASVQLTTTTRGHKLAFSLVVLASELLVLRLCVSLPLRLLRGSWGVVTLSLLHHLHLIFIHRLSQNSKKSAS